MAGLPPAGFNGLPWAASDPDAGYSTPIDNLNPYRPVFGVAAKVPRGSTDGYG